MVELQIVILAVAGSSPVGHPTFRRSGRSGFLVDPLQEIGFTGASDALADRLTIPEKDEVRQGVNAITGREFFMTHHVDLHDLDSAGALVRDLVENRHHLDARRARRSVKINERQPRLCQDFGGKGSSSNFR